MMTLRCKFHSGLWLVAILFLGLLTSCETKREIVTDLHEKEANEIVVFLAGHGIPAEKKPQVIGGVGAGPEAQTMWNIEVPSNQAVEALAILSRNGLPRRPVKSLLSIFAKTGLVSSAQEEQIRYQEGLSTQIAGVIRKIDGVIDADVQISFPSTEAAGGGPGDEPEGEVRASVYVKHSGILDDPNTQLVNKIKRLVAGSIVGLTFDNVTVVTDRARFTEVTIDEIPQVTSERDWESVWSVVVSRQSVGRFQTIFFILCLIILILALVVGWLIWKLYPLMQQGGGLRALVTSWKPIEAESAPPPAEPEEEEEEEGES